MAIYRHTEATIAVMARRPVIPVLTVADEADALAQARALVAGGLDVLEITLRTPAAIAGLAAIARAFPEAEIGAGTVLDVESMGRAIAAGAKFLVSPGVGPRLALAAADSPVPFLPGVASASEAMALRELGFRALKFFPAETVGGAGHLASLAGPLADLRFCPTGGIDFEKAKTYLALRNVVCVGGSWMVPAAALKARDYASVERLAREAAGLATGQGNR